MLQNLDSRIKRKGGQMAAFFINPKAQAEYFQKRSTFIDKKILKPYEQELIQSKEQIMQEKMESNPEIIKSVVRGETEKKLTCGIVRPIATIDNCSDAHWNEVHNILCEAITDAGFKPNLVSNASESGIIQKRIIENLYFNEIVVCDISAKNPNVMLELGMRLAFDKPTIVVKDDVTSFSFDTSPIEHVLYRRDLRFSSILEFKEKLTEKIIATHSKANLDPEYSTFLKHFGTFKVAKIEQKEVSKEDYIIQQLNTLSSEIEKLRKPETDPWKTFVDRATNLNFEQENNYFLSIPPNDFSPEQKNELLRLIRQHNKITKATLRSSGQSDALELTLLPGTNSLSIAEYVSAMIATIITRE